LKQDRAFPHVPTHKPGDLEDFGVFRETFLCHIYEADYSEAFRAFARVQGCLVGEAGGYWPFQYGDLVAHSLQAVLADLRHLESFLEFECEQRQGRRGGPGPGLSPAEEDERKREEALFALGDRLARQIAAMADELESVVGGWKFTESR
jgi:hypothetical protein